MTSVAVRACVRCHRKKVKCTGFPDCRTCSEASVQCEPYTRSRKADSIRALRDAEKRIQWLETELSREVGTDCRSLPTGTSTQKPPQQGYRMPQELTVLSPTESRSPGGIITSPATSEAPDISLLAFNATGEQKYLGPSSGAFFASYATALLQSCESTQMPNYRSGRLATANQVHTNQMGEQSYLQPDVIELLLKSYEMWVYPLYPLLSPETLATIVARCSKLQGAPISEFAARPETCNEMTVFYLAMALGATNHVNTSKQLRLFQDVSQYVPPAAYLYSMAVRYFSILAKELQSSVIFIQILLLVCIYSSYGPIESSQWQMAGLAIRTAIEIGLHTKPKDCKLSEAEMDWRNRIFWTAYSIEISLCYNLGRPPSISAEHITAELPLYSTNTAFAIKYVTHRQIQSRILSQVYSGTAGGRGRTLEQQQDLISNLQSELDQWRVSMRVLSSEMEGSAYPFSYWDRLYHGTSFVLHRRSPLCPSPSIASVERCIRSSGAYIDSMLEVLRTSNVPLSWMLVQGVLFAGLTMVVTARTSFPEIASNSGQSLLLVDFPAWTRKCSICLAIVNERWSDELLSKLDAQFEILTDSVQKTISTGLAFPTTDRSGFIPSGGTAYGNDASRASGAAPDADQQDSFATLSTELAASFDLEMTEDLDSIELFGGLLGFHGPQSFWDIYPQGIQLNENSQGWEQSPRKSHTDNDTGTEPGVFHSW